MDSLGALRGYHTPDTTEVCIRNSQNRPKSITSAVVCSEIASCYVAQAGLSSPPIRPLLAAQMEASCHGDSIHASPAHVSKHAKFSELIPL